MHLSESWSFQRPLPELFAISAPFVDRTGQDRTGQDRTGQDRQDRTGQDRTGQEGLE